MDKKDIYEHLAKIYLDGRKPTKLSKKRFFMSMAFILIPVIFLFIIHLNNKNRALNSEIALVLCADAVKINFHFDPVKKELYSLDLTKLDLRRFRTLGFSVKKAHYQDNIYLRVEFTSKLKERAEVYFKSLSHRWQDYKIGLREFKNISDWSSMSELSFIVEEWNVKDKRGVVYLDNVRLLR